MQVYNATWLLSKKNKPEAAKVTGFTFIFINTVFKTSTPVL